MDKSLPAGFTPTKFNPFAFTPVAAPSPEPAEYPYLELKNLCIKCNEDGCAEVTIVVKPNFMDKDEGLYGYSVCGIKAGKGCTIEKTDGDNDDEHEAEEDRYRTGLGKALDAVVSRVED